MRYYFLFLALVSITFSSFTGKVVFLHGTACAGKTSLCNELLQHSDHWKVVSEDDIVYERSAESWKKEFPEEFKAVEDAVDAANVLHAIMRNQILFQTKASEDKRVKAKNAIAKIQEGLDGCSKENKEENPDKWSNVLRRQITQTIIDLAQTHNVIVETWFLKLEHIEQISQQYNVIHVAAYCSFLDIIKRTLKRNYDAVMNGKNISTMRFFHQTLKSFTGLYKFSDSSQDSIDSLKKDDVIHGLDLVALCLHDSPDATGASKRFTRGEFSLEEFEEYRKDLMKKFTSEKVYVLPKFNVDTVVRTDQNNAIECAKTIIDIIKQNK